jgi:hypothetical protein
MKHKRTARNSKSTKTTTKKWWWKTLCALDQNDVRRKKFSEHEAAAFHYELARRNHDSDQFPAYNELLRGECDLVFFQFSQKSAGWKPPVAIHYHGVPPFHDGYVAFPSIGWNLRASKNALLEHFWKIIGDERNRRNIAEPSLNKGEKGRKSRNRNNNARLRGLGQPWRWLELLDNPHNLKSNDRSKLSQARKKSRVLKKDFEQLWKAIEQHRTFLKQYYNENPQALQIDREPMEW